MRFPKRQIKLCGQLFVLIDNTAGDEKINKKTTTKAAVGLIFFAIQ